MRTLWTVDKNADEAPADMNTTKIGGPLQQRWPPTLPPPPRHANPIPTAALSAPSSA